MGTYWTLRQGSQSAHRIRTLKACSIEYLLWAIKYVELAAVFGGALIYGGVVLFNSRKYCWTLSVRHGQQSCRKVLVETILSIVFKWTENLWGKDVRSNNIFWMSYSLCILLWFSTWLLFLFMYKFYLCLFMRNKEKIKKRKRRGMVMGQNARYESYQCKLQLLWVPISILQNYWFHYGYIA